MKPTIVFYKDTPSLQAYIIALDKNVVFGDFPDFPAHLDLFDQGRIQVLFVSAKYLTGWRTKYPHGQCDVVFLGDHWTDEEINQGNARTYPITRRLAFNSFFEGVKQFNLAAGNTVDHFNVRQSALYTGMQCEELAEKLKHLGLDSIALPLDMIGKEFKRGGLDHTFRTADREALLDDDVDILVVTVGSMLSMGADVDGATEEVNRANLAKVFPDGVLHKDSNGKVIKPDGWVGPDLSPFVNEG